MAREYNNEYLRRTANAVDGGDTPEGARILNNEYLRRIAEGIDDLVDAAGQATDPVDVTRLSGVISAANLPSYVDDVVEGYLHQGTFYEDSLHADAITPEAGKIYVDLSADTSYRWGGSSYVAIGRTLDAASQAEAEAGQDNAKYMTSLRTRQAIGALSPTYSDAVASTAGQGGSHGLMSAADKEKLDGIEGGANAYSLPDMSASTKGGAKVGSGLEIDDGVLSTTDDLGITGATVGQYPQVAAVDADGKPTEWTAANEYTLPVMSADVRGGAKIQPDSGLEIAGTDNLQVRLALESDGDVRGGIAELTAKGHAEQRTTTGKNLWGAFSEWNDASKWRNKTPTGNMTVTPMGDGWISFDWDNSNGSSAIFGNYFYVVNPLLEVSSTYTMITELRNVSFVSGSSIVWVSSTLDNEPQQFNEAAAAGSANPSNGVYYTTLHTKDSFEGSTTMQRGFMQAGKGSKGHVEVRMSLYEGSTATDYEPYTGGLPSPRPDWEQPIEVVRGRNLIDDSKSTDHALIDSSGVVEVGSASDLRRVSDYIEVSQGEYYLSNATPLTQARPAAVYDSSKGFVRIVSLGLSSATSGVVSIGANECFIRVCYFASDANRVQLTLGSTPQPYVPYGHVGMEVQGKNLIFSSFVGSIYSNGTIINESYKIHVAKVESGKTYTATTDDIGGLVCAFYASKPTMNSVSYDGSRIVQSDKTITAPIDGYIAFRSSSAYQSAQLELGSTATEYQPYYHTTTPIPLPQRGLVGSLPDGTADVLTLDGAGKCEWTLPTSEVTFDGSSDEGWKQQDVYTNNARYSIVTDAAFNKSNGGQLLCSHLPEGNAGSDSANIDLHGSQRMIQMTVPYLTVADFKTWLSTHNVTVLYPLATPVTEDCGYVDMPTDIPDGATITIPELDELGVRYFVDSGVTELARQWYARAHSEYEDRIAALESAVAELATS